MKGLKDENGSMLKLLRSIGLSENESIVYKFLVEQGGATTKDLLRKLNLRQPQLYDITSGLERKNFINIQDSRPKLYLPIDAELILENISRELEENRDELLNWAHSGRKSRDNVPSMWFSRQWRGFVINSRSVIAKANDTVCIESMPNLLPEFYGTLSRRVKEGLKAVLLVFGVERKRYEDEFLQRDAALFSEIRYAELGQFFSIIGDVSGTTFMPRKIALLPTERRYGYVFNDVDMSWFLMHTFFNAWYASSTLFQRDLSIPATYSSQRLAVNDLLKLFSSEKKVTVSVRGRRRIDDSLISIKGIVTDVKASPDVVNFTVESEGQKFVVGGYNSMVEDIEAEIIVLESAK
ncbi:MAG: hypothetical protein KIS30_06950 [Thermoplasmata archaeon]|nr:hypothetical protein [Candidatus Sysuiplasma acidicola]MBX8646475.1 hypothetical protein [Candidatus Sysuiplasma acidicola]